MVCLYRPPLESAGALYLPSFAGGSLEKYEKSELGSQLTDEELQGFLEEKLYLLVILLVQADRQHFLVPCGIAETIGKGAGAAAADFDGRVV